MEYYSARKRKEILTQATPWMNLQNLMLGEISHTQKTKDCVIHLYKLPSTGDSWGRHEEWWLSGAEEMVSWEVTA